VRGESENAPPFRINLLKAIIPFVPLVLLFMTSLPPPFRLLTVPMGWLVDASHFKGTASELHASFDSRLIGAAMLIGVAAAALSDRKQAPRTALTFFEGVAAAFTQIISLIVCANCFGEGVRQIGLAALLGRLLETWPGLPLSFALLSGSGMAATQSLFAFFVEPARRLGYDPLRLGAVVTLSASAGRTLSPVAAVSLMCASLVEVSPFLLVRRLAVPLLAGVLSVLLASLVFG
jgi:DcuC family C4-dicarboxylate transporter